MRSSACQKDRARSQSLCELQAAGAGRCAWSAARARGRVRGGVCRAFLVCRPVHERRKSARSYIDFRTQTKRGSTSARVSQRGNSTLESFLRPTHVRWPSPLSESQDSHPPNSARFSQQTSDLVHVSRRRSATRRSQKLALRFALPVGPSAVLIGRPGVFGGILLAMSHF